MKNNKKGYWLGTLFYLKNTFVKVKLLPEFPGCIYYGTVPAISR